jgi:hypothetical protein
VKIVHGVMRCPRDSNTCSREISRISGGFSCLQDTSEAPLTAPSSRTCVEARDGWGPGWRGVHGCASGVLRDTTRYAFVANADLATAAPRAGVVTHRFEDGRAWSCATASVAVARSTWRNGRRVVRGLTTRCAGLSLVDEPIGDNGCRSRGLPRRVRRRVGRPRSWLPPTRPCVATRGAPAVRNPPRERRHHLPRTVSTTRPVLLWPAHLDVSAGWRADSPHRHPGRVRRLRRRNMDGDRSRTLREHI